MDKLVKVKQNFSDKLTIVKSMLCHDKFFDQMFDPGCNSEYKISLLKCHPLKETGLATVRMLSPRHKSI